MARKIFFDTETTGFKPGQIGQLSLIIEEENGEVSARNYFFKIDYINEDAEKLLGRGVDFYDAESGGQRFADKAQEIADLFDGAVFVAHNLSFDENFLSTELWRCRLKATPSAKFDTMIHYKNILNVLDSKGRVKNPKLIEMVDSLGIDKQKLNKYCQDLFNCQDAMYHDARLDSTAVFVAFQLAKESQNDSEDKPWHRAFIE